MGSLAPRRFRPLLLMALVVVSVAIAAFPAQADEPDHVRREALGSSSTTGWEAEQKADRVVALPGQPPVEFDMYAGYITVNEEAGRAHYYFFVEAAEEPQKKPLMFWFNGGPGCSSIAFGFGEELGPFLINPGGQSLRLNPHAGNKLVNILFVDSPAGVGFSYTKTSNDLTTTGDNRTAHDNYAFVVNWLERFPQYKGRPFYLSGESYAGVYVPQLTKLIYENNKKRSEKDKVNLKGFILGNPVVDLYYDLYVGYADYLVSSSLISFELYNQIKIVCKNTTREILAKSVANYSDPCTLLLRVSTAHEIGKIDRHSVYTRACTNETGFGGFNPRQFIRGSGQLFLQGYDPCTYNYAAVYFNRLDVQKAMHANTTGIPYPWTGCNEQLHKSWQDVTPTVLPIYQELLLNTSLRLWVFSGDTDSVLPTLGTRYGLASLNLSVAVPWYPWYHKQQVGGRKIVYQGNLTFVTIRDAGHEVARLKGGALLKVMGAFLNGSLLPRAPYT